MSRQSQYWVDMGMSPILDSLPTEVTELEYPPPILHPSMQILIQHLPPGFQRLVSKGEIAMSNLELLFRISEQQLSLTNTQQQLPRGDAPTTASKIKRFRSFTDAFPILELPDVEIYAFQKLLCLALLLYSMTGPRNAGAYTHYMVKTRQSLTDQLPDFSKHLTPFYHQEQCLFWIWQITVASWRASWHSSVGELEEAGIRLELKQKQRFKAFYEADRVNSILGNFSWSTKIP